MSAGFYLKWDRQTGELVSSAGNVAIFDDIVVGHSGRLHDRAELAACLNLSADSEIALLLAAAYRRWGADFAAQVNGEYVASIVDRKCRQLTIASDVLGLWQAYIYELPGAIEVGSDLAMFAPYKLDLSNEYFEHYLTTGHLMSVMTPYVGIERTVPGVAEIFENSSHESRQVWSVSTLSERQYITEELAINKLRELLGKAMRNSVDGCESILLALSGGLDSSTIASVSAHEGLSGITAYSLVHPTTPEFDESSWAAMVVRESGIPWHQIDIERILPFQAFPKVITGEPSIAHLHQSQKEAIEQIRTTTAANAVMTGSGGDVVLGTYIGSYPIFLTDLLFAGNLGSTWRMLRAWQKDCVLKRSLLHWTTGGIVRPLLLHLRGKRQDTRPVQPPPNYMLIDAQSSSKFAPDLPRCRSPWLQMIAELLQKCAMSIASSRGIGHGPSIRTPLLYRPLVEFLLTLPIDFLYRSTVDRYLQRVALKGILPEKVRRRATKASGSWTLIEGLRQSHEWQDFLSDRSILSEMGLIDLEQWRQAVAMAKHGNTQGDMYFMASASAEIWLRMRADTQ